MTYQEYLKFACYILQKPCSERLISIEQINSLIEEKKSSAALESLLQLYPPYGGAFDKVIARSLMVIRAEHAERPRPNRRLHIGVHDAIYSSSREKTAQWLRSNFSSQDSLPRIFQTLREQIATDNYDSPLIDSARQRYNTRQRERVNAHVWCETLYSIKKDMRDYLDHLAWKYGDGAQCGRQEFMLIMNWVTQAPTPEEKKERMGVLLLAVDDARTGYHAIKEKYVRGKDYTCMPGLLERLLDAMTTIYYDATRTRERSIPTLLVEALTNPMIKTSLNGRRCVSDTLYAAYLKAAGYRVRSHSEQRCARKSNLSEESVAALREQYMRLKWEEVLQQHTELEQKKGEKERLKKERLRGGGKTAPTMPEIALQREIAMLLIKLRPYMIERHMPEPQTFLERLTALLWSTAEKDDQLIQSAEDIDLALRTSFDSHMEHIPHQQNLSDEQKYFGFDSIFLEDQKVTKKTLMPKKQAPTSAEVFEILSETFFLGKTHADIVLSLSGQNPNLDLDEHHYYGLAEMASLAEAGYIPETSETCWPKKEAWELYESYVRHSDGGEIIWNLKGGEMIILEHFELCRNEASRNFLEKCFHSQELLLKIARHRVVRKKFIKYCWDLQIDEVLNYLYDQQAMNELLQEAIVGGNNIDSLALLMTKGADINAPMSEGYGTPLIYFLGHNLMGTRPIIEYLLSIPHLDLKCCNDVGQGVIELACSSQHIGLLPLLIQKGAQVPRRFRRHSAATYPLHAAVIHQCPEAVAALRAHGHLTGLNEPLYTDYTCLTYSIDSTHEKKYDVIRELLECPGVNINLKDKNNTIPITEAYHNRDQRLLLLLLQKGRTCDIQGLNNVYFGKSLWELASLCGYVGVLSLLTQPPYNMSINDPVNGSSSLLSLSLNSYNNELIDFLINHKDTDLTACDAEGNNYLMQALERNHYAHLEKFAQHCGIEDRNNDGETALIVFVKSYVGRQYGGVAQEVLNLLISSWGADILAMDNEGRAAFESFLEQAPEFAPTFLKNILKKMKPDRRSAQGVTPLMMALALDDQPAIAKFLKKHQPSNDQSDDGRSLYQWATNTETRALLLENDVSPSYLDYCELAELKELLGYIIDKKYSSVRILEMIGAISDLSEQEQLITYFFDRARTLRSSQAIIHQLLHDSIAYKNERVFQRVIAVGQSVMCPAPHDYFIVFSRIGSEKSVIQCLNDPIAGGQGERTLLMAAVEAQCVNIVKTLLNCQVDVNWQNSIGESALSLAQQGRSRIIVNAIRAKAEPDACSSSRKKIR